jgi:NADH dehydrogenase FAD-containing subunit
MFNKSRKIYSCIRITNNVRANKIKLLCKEASTSSRLKEKNAQYDIIVAGGGMVGTTLACTLG